MICASELVVFVTGVAVALAQDRSDDELALMGAVFTQLGDTLTTIATQRALLEAKQNNQNNSAK